jgi:hypothetical protein
MSSMKRLIAVALTVALGSLPLLAQRGGHGGGSIGHSGGGSIGRSGGFASHNAPVFRGGSAPVARSFGGAAQFSSSRFAGATPNRRISGRNPIASAPDRRRGNFGVDRDRRPFTRVYGVPVPYVSGYLGPGFLDSSDYGPYDDSGYVSPQPPASYPPDQYEAPPPYADQADAPPAAPYRPSYQRPQKLSPQPEEEAAVTLVFKDGRPTEQIHNYMLTRTTLYVQEQHIREIPVDQLDLAATIKVNKDAGVDFQLPGKGI